MEEGLMFPPAPPTDDLLRSVHSGDVADDADYLSDLSDEFNNSSSQSTNQQHPQALALDEVTFDRDIRLVNVPSRAVKGRQLYDPTGNSAQDSQRRALFNVPDDSRFPSGRPGQERKERRRRERKRSDKNLKSSPGVNLGSGPIRILNQSATGTSNAQSSSGTHMVAEEEAQAEHPKHCLALDDVPYDRNLKYVNVPSGARPKPKIATADSNRFLKQVQDITISNANELEKLDEHYIQLDNRKKNHDATAKAKAASSTAAGASNSGRRHGRSSRRGLARSGFNEGTDRKDRKERREWTRGGNTSTPSTTVESSSSSIHREKHAYDSSPATATAITSAKSSSKNPTAAGFTAMSSYHNIDSSHGTAGIAGTAGAAVTVTNVANLNPNAKSFVPSHGTG